MDINQPAGICEKANCQPGSWEQWAGEIEEGSCGTQTRIRPQILSWSMEQQTGSCNGIQKSCPAPKKEFRKMCKCFLIACVVSIGNCARARTISQPFDCMDKRNSFLTDRYSEIFEMSLR